MKVHYFFQSSPFIFASEGPGKVTNTNNVDKLYDCQLCRDCNTAREFKINSKTGLFQWHPDTLNFASTCTLFLEHYESILLPIIMFIC